MSITALAKDLNLSISTVSRALNGYTDVSQATRERVALRAKELGYRPHAAARRLKSGKAHAVGVVLPAGNPGGAFVDSLYANLLGGIAAELEQHQFHLLATTLPGADLDREIALYEQMVSGGSVDGLIIVRTRVLDPRVMSAQRMGLPFVTFGRTEVPEPHAWVDTDNERVFEEATLRQLNRGHRRIAFLNAPLDYNFAKLRAKGYRKALLSFGLPVDESLIGHGDVNEKSGYALCETALRLTPAPTAVICATDQMAVGAMAACRAQGLQPGADVAFTGYGNSDMASYTTPSLTTVEHFPFENGRYLGGLLMQIIQSDTALPEPPHHLATTRLVERESDRCRGPG